MNKIFCAAAFLSGALAVVWVGVGYIGSNPLALAMTLVIGAVYALGAFELLHFRRATGSLTTALAALPTTSALPNLDAWLDRVHPALQNPVRLRIEGERIGLPCPALTPYLVGLLVMLGMLGTFLGMVVTLNGAVFALEGTTDLQAIRSALAAPVKGLGLAFGTSVAGVAASAMLGLISALVRRERLLTAQQLDTKISTVLRDFSLTHQRQETFKALQRQAQALPDVADKLQTTMLQLLANQENFHTHVKVVYSELAHSVEKSLKDSLTASARAAGDSIKPVVEAAMTGIAQETKSMHERMTATTQTQLDGLTTRLSASAANAANAWMTALTQHERSSAGLVDILGRALETFSASLEQRSSALLTSLNATYSNALAERTAAELQQREAWVRSLESMAATLQHEWRHAGVDTHAQQQQICATLAQTARAITDQAKTHAEHTLSEIARLAGGAEDSMRSRIATEADWLKQQRESMDGLSAILRTELGALRDAEALRGNAAVERLDALQTALTRHLTTLGVALEEPITRLIHTASEAPRAAAEVIVHLRRQISDGMTRDNELLEERSRIMETLNTLLAAIGHASVEQRTTIDALVSSSAGVLDTVGQRFAAHVDAEAAKLTAIGANIGAHIGGSAIEMSSLSEAFGFAVQSFSDANEKLIANLQRIETAMDKSTARSDEQLGYYVAQAREIIDLCVMSQKQTFEELRRLADKPTLSADGTN